MASDLERRLRRRLINPDGPEAADALAAQAAEIERLKTERDLEKAVAAAAVEEAVAMCRERAKLVRRIRNQRAALRQNWEIVEMRNRGMGSPVQRRFASMWLARKKAAEARADALAARVAALEGVLLEAREEILHLSHARGSEVEGADAEIVSFIDDVLHPKAPAPAGGPSQPST